MKNLGLNRISQFLGYAQSASEFKKVSVVATAAMLSAVGALLQFFTIPVSDFIQITFVFTVYIVAAIMYGPAVSGVVAVCVDILKFLIKPTGAFFPGFTVSAILTGTIYGISFYRRKVSFWRILITQLVIDLVVHIVLNTVWLSMMYNKAGLFLLPARALKTLALFPIEIIIVLTVTKVTEHIKKRLGK